VGFCVRCLFGVDELVGWCEAGHGSRGRGARPLVGEETRRQVADAVSVKETRALHCVTLIVRLQNVGLARDSMALGRAREQRRRRARPGAAGHAMVLQQCRPMAISTDHQGASPTSITASLGWRPPSAPLPGPGSSPPLRHLPNQFLLAAPSLRALDGGHRGRRDGEFPIREDAGESAREADDHQPRAVLARPLAGESDQAGHSGAHVPWPAQARHPSLQLLPPSQQRPQLPSPKPPLALKT
jgi:hypothetical protein